MDFAEVIFMSGYKSGYSTKNRRKNLRFYVDFSMELMGVEPMSEKKLVRVSPGAVCLLDFPWCGRAYTHYTLVASLIPDGRPSSSPFMFST